jgi:hypothetical protein
MAFHLSPLVNLIYSEDWEFDMEDYSHCHYWNNERECIGFSCDNCEYRIEHEKSLIKVELDEELFEI